MRSSSRRVVLGFLATVVALAWVSGCGADKPPPWMSPDSSTDATGDTAMADTPSDYSYEPPPDGVYDPFDDTIADPTGEPLPPDADDDGLPDDVEVTLGTDPHDPDTDDDGYTDGVEALAGTNPRDPWSKIPETDYYVILPYMGAPDTRELDFTARLGKGDVFFLVDTTGSMITAINNVRNSLATVIVPAVSGAIADVVMGVGDFRDFPNGVYGDMGDWPYQLRQPMTADIAAVQTALNNLHAGGGADEPESMLEGFHGAVTGGSCPAGMFGTACFREDSHPIIVAVTDATCHNCTDTLGWYDGSVSAHTWTETMDALNARNVKILGAAVKILAFIPAAGRPDLVAAAEDTGSYTSAGVPTVYDSMGGDVSAVVVDGIVDLVGAATQDVSARSEDDPTDSVDARQFIKSIRPVWASSATSWDLTTFYGVSGGTTVRFSITFLNDFLPQGYHVQLFRAQIVVHDVPGMTTLDVRNVYIVVPAIGGALI